MDQVGNAVDDNTGLAASCPGKDEDRAVCRRHGFALPEVEAVKQGRQRCQWGGVSNRKTILSCSAQDGKGVLCDRSFMKSDRRSGSVESHGPGVQASEFLSQLPQAEDGDIL